ncbi:MAG: phosphate signaling complex protein PhoU [Candidatus Micropelagos thuwalensis]
MVEKQHIVTAFDEDLAILNDMMAKMGALAETQLFASTEALITRNPSSLDDIIKRDKELDNLEAVLNDKVIEIIALRAPLAEDLRRVIVALKVASTLERIGDLAKNIAKRNKVILRTSLKTQMLPSIKNMTSMVLKMLNKTLDAYVEVDAKTALEVMYSDIEVDKLNTVIFQSLIEEMSSEQEQLKIGPHLLFVAKNIERVGDHVTSIAEQIYFLYHGEMPDRDRPKADYSSSVTVS